MQRARKATNPENEMTVNQDFIDSIDFGQDICKDTKDKLISLLGDNEGTLNYSDDVFQSIDREIGITNCYLANELIKELIAENYVVGSGGTWGGFSPCYVSYSGYCKIHLTDSGRKRYEKLKHPIISFIKKHNIISIIIGSLLTLLTPFIIALI